RQSMPLHTLAVTRKKNSSRYNDRITPEVFMRLLLIEDDEAVAQVLAEAFGSQGHETIIRYTGEDGLAYVASERPDAVVLDDRLAQHVLGARRRSRIARPPGTPRARLELGSQPVEDQRQVDRFGVHQEQRQPGASPRRHGVCRPEVSRDVLRGRRDDAFFIPSGDALDGEAHERKAVSQSLRLVDLEVDEEREQRRIDEPPAAD